MSDKIHVVFDGPPSHKSGRFIEVETPDGKSCKCGEWKLYGGGISHLVISVDDIRSANGRAPKSNAVNALSRLVECVTDHAKTGEVIPLNVMELEMARSALLSERNKEGGE